MRELSDDFAEPKINRRKLLLALMFGSAAAVAAWRQPWRRIDYLGRQKLEDLVPKKIGQWSFVSASGLVVPPEDQLRDAIYSQVLTRVYSDGSGSSIMFLAAQSSGQTGFLQIHRPETCYAAGGYSISRPGSHVLDAGGKSIHAIELDASLDGRTEHIMYWTRIGNLMPRSWREQKLAVAKQNLEGIIPDAILVRVSTVSPDPASARTQIDRFVLALLDAVPADRRTVFIA
jgi:EpsI family protein